MSKASKVLDLIHESTSSNKDYRLLATFLKLLMGIDFKFGGNILLYEKCLAVFIRLGRAFGDRSISAMANDIFRIIKTINNSEDVEGMDQNTLNVLEDKASKLKQDVEHQGFTKTMLSFQKSVISLKKIDKGLDNFIKRYVYIGKKIRLNP